MGSQKSQKKDPGLIFKGLGGGPKNGAPSRAPKSEILPLFTTLELGPTSQKGTPFWSFFGDQFCQKNGKRGSRKVLKINPKKHSKWVPVGVPIGTKNLEKMRLGMHTLTFEVPRWPQVGPRPQN